MFLPDRLIKAGYRSLKELADANGVTGGDSWWRTFGYPLPDSLWRLDAAPTDPPLPDLTGLAVWLDGADPRSLTVESGVVAQWKDKSGNGNHFTQADPDLRPGTGSLNGRGTVAFDGTQRLELLDTDLFQNVEYGAVYIVVKGTYSGSGSRIAFVATTNGSTAASRVQMLFNNTGSYAGGGRRLDAVSYAQLVWSGGSDPLVNGDPYILGWEASWASAQLRLRNNGGNQGPSSWLSEGATSDTPSNVYLAGNGDATSFNGQVAEVIVLRGAVPSTEERDALESYLSEKWGIALSTEG